MRGKVVKSNVILPYIYIYIQYTYVGGVMAAETDIHFCSKWIFKLYLLTKPIAPSEKHRHSLTYNRGEAESNDCQKI